MQIQKYGIILKRLEEQDIELVRQMRNAQHINKYMHFQEYITEEMQKKWFESINNLNNFYFLICVNDKKVGLIHGKKMNFNDVFAVEGGIFIWDKEIYHTHVPVASSLIMADFTFYFLKLSETYAKVLKSNIKAHSYNLKLGYEVYEDDNEVNLMKLVKSNYERSVIKIRKGLGLISNDYTVLSPKEIYITEDLIKEIKVNFPNFKNQFNNL